MASELQLLPGESEALEREYNLRVRHPERTHVYQRFAQASARLRAAWPGFAAHRYGSGERALIDFFPAQTDKPAPLLLFIHGGYWRALDRENFSFLARPWLEHGIHVAMPGYDLAPAMTVSQIVDQVRAARDWLLLHADALRIDATRILVSGHSAGGHLGALVLANEPHWRACGLVGLSGLYDLRPLLATSVNRDIRLDPPEAARLSPTLLAAPHAVRYLCAVGGAETMGFRQQSIDYAQVLSNQGHDARCLVVGERTHFDILDDMADRNAPLFRHAIDLISPPGSGASS